MEGREGFGLAGGLELRWEQARTGQHRTASTVLGLSVLVLARLNNWLLGDDGCDDDCWRPQVKDVSIRVIELMDHVLSMYDRAIGEYTARECPPWSHSGLFHALFSKTRRTQHMFSRAMACCSRAMVMVVSDVCAHGPASLC